MNFLCALNPWFESSYVSLRYGASQFVVNFSMCLPLIAHRILSMYAQKNFISVHCGLQAAACCSNQLLNLSCEWSTHVNMNICEHKKLSHANCLSRTLVSHRTQSQHQKGLCLIFFVTWHQNKSRNFESSTQRNTKLISWHEPFCFLLPL